jgi:hypothetical protein
MKKGNTRVIGDMDLCWNLLDKAGIDKVISDVVS